VLTAQKRAAHLRRAGKTAALQIFLGHAYTLLVRRRNHSAHVRGEGAKALESEKNVGLARALSKLGFCSRAQAAAMVAAGRVRLNGAVRKNPEVPVHLNRDTIEVDGQAVRAAEKLYWMLNKPRGAVTTAADEKGRQTVYDHLRADLNWLAPVGRLDKASEGLLLFTNDTAWAARILAPETHLEKTYHVQIATIADERLLETTRGGVREGGDFLRVTRASVLRRGERNSWLEIVLDEVKNRQIRRLLQALGVETMRLVRVAIGPLQLGDLAKGTSRQLTGAEKRAIDQALGAAKVQ
jgi:23S rRNA pseudouridine2605 synthase